MHSCDCVLKLTHHFYYKYVQSDQILYKKEEAFLPHIHVICIYALTYSICPV